MSHKIGIVGYGGMAGWHHENSRNIEGLEFSAAYDIVPERLKVAKERDLKIFDNLDDFLRKGDFDIVLVATPNNFHKEMSIAAMDSGRHVVCEKPAAMSSREFQEMMDASVRNNVIFTVHQNRRWDRDFRKVWKVVRDGMIGRPYTIESRVHGSGGVIHGWRAYKVAGGGMLLDWGVHLLDQIMHMVPEKVVNVFARLYKVRTPEVDDYCKAVLTFESGLSAQIEVGTYCLKPLPRWYVNGDLGSAYVNDWECNGAILHARKLAIDWEPEIVHTAAGPTRTMAPRPKETVEELPLPDIQTDWTDYYYNVMAAIDRKEELLVKPCEAMRVLKVIEACFESDDTGCSVTVNV